MSIYINGAMPKYEGLPSNPTPDSGYPHGARNASIIAESIWGDVINLKSVVCAIKAMIYSKRLEYSTITAARKISTDRTFSGEFRTIADIRRINIFINTGDYSPIFLPEIKKIAGRIVWEKRQFPALDVQM